MDAAVSSERAAREAAAVVIELLRLDDPVETVIDDLTLLESAPPQTTFAAEFESSLGTMAFLIYIYDYVGAIGPTGQVAYTDAVRILVEAAALDSPGPRILSNFETSEAGVILATTPATYALLQAGAGGEGLAPAALPLPTKVWKSEAERAKERREQAERLLRTLKAAEKAAARWQEAADLDDDLMPAEAELALFLNDERSIPSLIEVLGLMLNVRPTRRR